MELETLLSLDRLNSWVRSRYRRNGRRMVYWMKNEVLCHGYGFKMDHKGIVVAVKCRDCNGTGKFTTWVGDKLDHCWACNNSGTAQLRFVETVIEDKIRWHTPCHLFPKYWTGPCEIEMGWAPNQPGEDMDPWEAAAAFNLTEPCFPRPSDYHTDCGTFNHFRYSLYVGETPRVCTLCGARGFRLHNLCVIRQSIEWTDHACDGCYDYFKAKDGTAIFAAFPMPSKLIDHPEIKRWMERHDGT